MRYTPENIEELKDGEVFVFGSNLSGIHAGGAARTAFEKFGAEYEIGEGLTGRCYAFPTLGESMLKRGWINMIESKKKFFSTARALPEKTFLVTKVGCGIAGFPIEAMAELFRNHPKNVVIPKEFSTI